MVSLGRGGASTFSVTVAVWKLPTLFVGATGEGVGVKIGEGEAEDDEGSMDEEIEELDKDVQLDQKI